MSSLLFGCILHVIILISVFRQNDDVRKISIFHTKLILPTCTRSCMTLMNFVNSFAISFQILDLLYSVSDEDVVPRVSIREQVPSALIKRII